MGWGGDEGRGGGGMDSPALPLGPCPRRSGSSYPVGSGCRFCRVILSCPEGSWPTATFLVGSEHHKVQKLPFSPDPQLCSPVHRLVSQQPLLAANTLFQVRVCVCVCVSPWISGPPWTLSSSSKDRPTGRAAASVPVPEGREEARGRVRNY